MDHSGWYKLMRSDVLASTVIPSPIYFRLDFKQACHTLLHWSVSKIWHRTIWLIDWINSVWEGKRLYSELFTLISHSDMIDRYYWIDILVAGNCSLDLPKWSSRLLKLGPWILGSFRHIQPWMKWQTDRQTLPPRKEKQDSHMIGPRIGLRWGLRG